MRAVCDSVGEKRGDSIVRGIPLTGEQEKKIVADYEATGTYAEAARRNGLSASGVKKVVLRREDLRDEAREAASAVNQSMEDYLRGQQDRVRSIIDSYLDALADLDRFEKLTPVQLSTVIGTLIDKWAMLQRQQESGGQSGGVVILPEVDNG